MAAISSAELLSNELITEILSWLPAKSLMRFTCVSKTWNSLIINSYFVKLHHKRSIIFQRDLRNEAEAYCIMGEKHLFRALKNSDHEKHLFSAHDEKSCAFSMKEAMKEADLARECFRVAEEISYVAAMKEGDSENARGLLYYIILFFRLVLRISYRYR
ncbi:hypothetical protein V8G54_037075 [Vigna mungo]|uniref:F-box domain-containing protein n=1 Tax=Vigna mungo TaxID=3915 RepID=A0AAQ3MHX0_VIGMU